MNLNGDYIMDDMTKLAEVERIAENMSLMQYLADWDDDLTYDEIMESLNDGTIPEGVYVWEVVEN